ADVPDQLGSRGDRVVDRGRDGDRAVGVDQLDGGARRRRPGADEHRGSDRGEGDRRQDAPNPGDEQVTAEHGIDAGYRVEVVEPAVGGRTVDGRHIPAVVRLPDEEDGTRYEAAADIGARRIAHREDAVLESRAYELFVLVEGRHG